MMKKLFITLFLLASPAFASAEVIDQFNSDTKTVGDLASQDCWNAGSTAFDVVAAAPPAQEGDQGVTGTNANGTIQCAITGQTASRISVYGRAAQTDADAYPLNLIETATAKCQLYFATDNNIKFANDLAGITDTLVTGYNANQWYLFEVEVKASDDTCRARIDNGTWTAFQATTAFASIDVVRFNEGATTVAHFDDLQIDRAEAATPPPPRSPLLWVIFSKIFNTAHAALLNPAERVLIQKIQTTKLTIRQRDQVIQIFNKYLRNKTIPFKGNVMNSLISYLLQ